MKRVIVILLFASIAINAKAQDGYLIGVRYNPETIEILPGVYELFGTIVSGKDIGKESYAITMNGKLAKEVADSVTAGKPQFLWGPKLEKLVQEKVIADYRKIRTDVENSLKKKISETKNLIEKTKIKKQLVVEQQNTETYMARLSEIVERANVRCIYIYGWGDSSFEKDPIKTGSGMNNVGTTKKGNIPNQPD